MLCRIMARETVRRSQQSDWFPDKGKIIDAVKADPEAQQIMARAGWDLDLAGHTHFKPLWPEVYKQLALSERDPLDKTRRQLEAGLVALGLERLEIAPSVDQLSETAAHLFVELVRDGDRVAISCGSTLERMVDEVEKIKHDFQRLTVYSGVVICSEASTRTLPSTVANLFTHCGDGIQTVSYHLPLGIPALLIPPVSPVSSDQRMVSGDARHTLARHLKKCLFESAHDADFVFLGIGVLDDTDRGAFSTHVREIGALAAMKHHRVVGEVFHWPFDQDGCFLYDRLGLPKAVARDNPRAWETIDPSLRSFFENTYTMGWSDLTRRHRRERASTRHKQRRTTTIAVAGGAAKHEAIWLALTRLPDPAQPDPAIDVLVTDVATAEYLADRVRSDPKRG